MRVVRSGQQIEGRRGALDRVPAEATSKDRAQVEALEFVVKEITVYEYKQTRRKITVISRPAANCISGKGRGCALLVVGRVNRVCVSAAVLTPVELVKCNIQVLARAIAARQCEP